MTEKTQGRIQMESENDEKEREEKGEKGNVKKRNRIMWRKEK
jgi:hypothetical protein